MTDARRSAAVVGLGLIGGSVARDLAAAGWRVLAADRDPDSLRAARDAGVATPFDIDAAPAGEVSLVVVAVPPGSASSVLRRVAAWVPEGAVVTDVASTKRSVVEAAVAAGLARRFVGSHPMAGDHRSGWAASRAGLFRGARVWLCPAPGADDDAVRRVADLWRELGANAEPIAAETHDRRIAWASHLPQAAASALAGALALAGVPPDALGPGGRDATRLARSDPELWRDILADNRDQVIPALDALLERLEALRDALRAGEDEAVRAALAAGRDYFRSTPRMRGAVGGNQGSSR